MKVEELLNLDRPLTPKEMAFMEEEVLKLARALQAEVARITADVPEDGRELVEKLKRAAASTVENIEAAIAIPSVPRAEGPAREA